MVHHPDKAATCTATGNIEYRVCTDCGKCFTNAAGTAETTAEAVKIAKVANTPSTKWTTDATNHWHTCYGCTELLDKTAHAFDEWTVTTPATTQDTGTETRDIPKLEAQAEPDTMQTTEPTTELSYMLGDINEDNTVTAADARLGLRISASLYKPTDNQLLAADADENGIVTASDARIIFRVSAQLDSFKETSKVDDGTDDFSKYVEQSSAKVFSDFADAKDG